MYFLLGEKNPSIVAYNNKLGWFSPVEFLQYNKQIWT